MVLGHSKLCVGRGPDSPLIPYCQWHRCVRWGGASRGATKFVPRDRQRIVHPENETHAENAKATDCGEVRATITRKVKWQVKLSRATDARNVRAAAARKQKWQWEILGATGQKWKLHLEHMGPQKHREKQEENWQISLRQKNSSHQEEGRSPRDGNLPGGSVSDFL